MTIIDTSFTAVGKAIGLFVKSGRSFTYSVSGTFVGTAILEKTLDGGKTHQQVLSATAPTSGQIDTTLPDGGSAHYRWRIDAYTSGTIVTEVADVAQVLQTYVDQSGNVVFQVSEAGVVVSKRTSRNRVIPAAIGKVGATSGFVPANADNLSLATCPASKTASTLIVPITGLKVGDVLQGISIQGELSSVGGAVTVDLAIRSGTSASGSITDALIGSMTQVALSASAILSAANALLSGLAHAVVASENLYALITVTTAASTSVAIQSLVAIVDEV